jgi:hypothetical protein
MPAKPCAGAFSEETILALVTNTNRAQWNSQTCDLCGQQVGAKLVGAKWLPEQHWPSVNYAARAKRGEKRPKATPAKSLASITVAIGD